MNLEIIATILLVVAVVGLILYIVIVAIDDGKIYKNTIEKLEREAEELMYKDDLKGVLRNLNNVESDLFELEGKPVEKKEYGEICSELREEIDSLILKYRAKIREIENEESK